MDGSQLLHAIMKYRPAETRNPVRPQKRLLDSYIETRTGHGTKFPDSIKIMMII